MKRNRIVYAGLIVLIVLLGLLSRTSMVPDFIYPYVGDYFYALMFFFVIGFVFPRLSSLKVAFFSIGICFAIVLLQLYQAHWINEIRSSKLGGLILGYGFLWSDILSYTLGGFTGFILESRFHSSENRIG